MGPILIFHLLRKILIILVVVAVLHVSISLKKLCLTLSLKSDDFLCRILLLTMLDDDPYLMLYIQPIFYICLQKGFIPLHLASKYGQLETANLLLKRGSSPDASGKVSFFVSLIQMQFIRLCTEKKGYCCGFGKLIVYF